MPEPIDRATPPRLDGLPLLGNAIAYERDPVALFRRGYSTLGKVFAIRLGPRPVAVLLGPEHNRFLFSQTGKALSRTPSLAWMIRLFGEEFAVVTEGERYRRHLPLYTRPFQEARINGYLRLMAECGAAWFDELGAQGEFELGAALGALVSEMAMRVILGEEVRAQTGSALRVMFHALGQGSGSHLTRNLVRFLPHRRRERARRALHEALRAALRTRAGADRPRDDYLQAVVDAVDPDGQPYGDEVRANLILGYAWIGYETTVGHCCWSMIHLLQNPAELERVVNEQEAGGAGERLADSGSLDRLERLGWALKESERLRPAVMVIGRHVVEEVEVGGYRIPVGWRVMISPPVSHRLPDVFADPDRYEPERFSPERAEDRRQPGSLIGFGGGLHACAGKRVATLQIKLILSMLLRRYRLELVDRDPQPRLGPHTNLPRVPVRVRYRAR